MNKTIQSIGCLLVAVAMLPAFTACEDDETYADKLKKEKEQIKGFLHSGAQVIDEDAGEYVLDIPGNIKVISEAEFSAQDSTTDVAKNEYVLFSNTGVYMQIVRKGTGKKLEHGETTNLVMRYVEFDIARDSVKTTNRSIAYAMQPDIMTCTNSYGTFSAAFTAGRMLSFYQSSSVPSGWLIPLSYIKLGRQNSEDAEIALVRLIVPSGQGQTDAINNVYPCFYEISYQRDRTVSQVGL